MPKKSYKGKSKNRTRDRAPVRRAEVRVFMRPFVNPTQPYFIEIDKLVPKDQQLPCNDEMLQYVNVRTAVVSGNNTAGVVMQFGLAGPFAQDSNDFLPVSYPQVFTRNGKLFTHLAIPHITKQMKGVLSDKSNRIVVRVTAVQGQIDNAAFVFTFTSGFVVPILEYQVVDVGTPQPYEAQKTSGGAAPPSVEDAPDFILDEANYTSPTLFPLKTKDEQNGTATYVWADFTQTATYTVTGLTSGFRTNGVFEIKNISDLQGQYSAVGFSGNIAKSANSRPKITNEERGHVTHMQDMVDSFNNVNNGCVECKAFKDAKFLESVFGKADTQWQGLSVTETSSEAKLLQVPDNAQVAPEEVVGDF